ncbi:MAG: aldo/keto reductase [Proteobacteria bacterium]|nr:aldo/keto reductase [Pseudomonadota bacterium]
MTQTPAIALGCMRLSTHKRPSREQALSTLHAALDAGVRVLDTADAYCLDDTEVGHNERLIAEALRTWDGPSSDVLVATKGGLTRPKGAWLPDGRAKHLTAACEASADALGVEQIDLYQLHAVDPRTKFTTSVRALAKLHKAGRVKSVGLSNVRVHEIEQAQKLVPVSAIQVAINPFVPTSLRNGVAAYALEHDMMLLAYAPFGGPRDKKKLRRHPVLRELAEAHGVSVYQVALAWLRGLSPKIIPLVGSTRPESIRDSAASLNLELTEAEALRLDEAFPAGRNLRVPVEERRPSADADGEVVLLMGYPASGKSSLAKAYTDRGYARLNRDEEGGSLGSLVPKLGALLDEGQRRVVLDNTYPDRASRNAVLETAWARGVPVRCDWLQTSEQEASVNASLRMVERHGGMLGPEGISEAGKQWANTFGPSALLRYRRTFEEPRVEEGFAELVPIAFERRPSPVQSGGLFVFSDVIWESRSGAKRPKNAEDLVLHAVRIAALAADERPVVVLHRDGDRTEEQVSAMFAKLREQLPDVYTAWCGHPSGPPVCWCRPPYPGLLVQGALEVGVNLPQSTLLGGGRSGPRLVETLGMELLPAESLD